jgi:hypothetical protein
LFHLSLADGGTIFYKITLYSKFIVIFTATKQPILKCISFCTAFKKAVLFFAQLFTHYVKRIDTSIKKLEVQPKNLWLHLGCGLVALWLHLGNNVSM